jgi:hypothetical protein
MYSDDFRNICRFPDSRMTRLSAAPHFVIPAQAGMTQGMGMKSIETAT